MFNVDAPVWFQDAPCVGEDRLFFSSKPSRRKMAISICNNICTHREDCLQFALRNGVTVGVWGGNTGPDLVRLLEGSDLAERV